MKSPLDAQIKSYEKKLAGYEKEVKRGAARILNVGSKRVKSKVAKSVTADVKVKQSIIKKQIFTSRAKSNSLSAYVKSYLRPISAARLLTQNQLNKAPRGTNRKGVRVAGRQFDGAFINRGKKSGRHKVMQRKGKERYPLKRINIRIDSSIDANQLPISKRFMRDDFVRLYERELKYRTSKYAR